MTFIDDSDSPWTPSPTMLQKPKALPNKGTKRKADSSVSVVDRPHKANNKGKKKIAPLVTGLLLSCDLSW